MTRDEYLEALLPGVRQTVVHFVGAEQERRARATLDQYTTNELSLMYGKQVAAGSTKTPAPTPAPSATWADVAIARQEAEEELREIRLRGVAERCADNELFKLRKQEWEKPQREAQLRRDREIFLDAYQTLRSFGNTEANFSLLREVLGKLTVFGIRNVIQANSVQLSPPTQAELEAWQSEDVEAHNQALLNANPVELRAAVRSESLSRRAQTAVEAQKQADLAHEARDAARQYPPLPNERNGKPLDASYIKRADKTELRFLLSRWGQTQVTNRLRGIDSAQPKGE